MPAHRKYSSAKKKKGSRKKSVSRKPKSFSRKKASVVRKASSYKKKALSKYNKVKKVASYHYNRSQPSGKPFNVGTAVSRGTDYAALGGGIGSMFGPLGSLVGTGIGALAGGILGGISGHGNYNLKSNSLAIPGTAIPSFDSDGKRCFRLTHREYVYDVTGSTSNYALSSSFAVNPANPALFLWGSSIASNFEEYRIEGMIAELRSISGNVVSSTDAALGYMGLAFEPNSTLPLYTNKQQFDNSEFASSGPPSANVCIPIECKRSQNVLSELYTNNGNLPSNADARLYDLGILEVVVGNQQSAYVVAELWISYDICFYKPKYAPSSVGGGSSHYAATAGISTSAYFGNNGSYVSDSSWQPVLGATTITFPTNMPSGNYQLTYQVTGGSTTVVGPTFVASNGASDFDVLVGDTVAFYHNPSITATRIIGVYFFQIGAYTNTATQGTDLQITSGPVITFSNATMPTSPTSMDLIITQMNFQIS